MTAGPSTRELFTDLLRELRVAGPIHRLRLLGRAVGTLRRLSPWDRKVLLKMAGFEGSEVLIERLAAGDAETAQRLTRLLADIERDPEAFEETARSLADPASRGAAIDSLIAALDHAAREAGEQEAPLPAAIPEPPAPAPVPQPPRPAPASIPATTALAVAVASSSAPAAEPPPAPPAEKPISRPTPVSRPAPGPVAAPPPPPTPPTPPTPPPDPRPKSPPEILAAPSRPAGGERGQAPRADLSEIFPERTAARGVMSGLLELRRRLAGGETVSVDELRRLISREIPVPWARRRAILAWIEDSALTDPEDALRLIGELANARDRTWCLAALAASRRWPGGAWEKIVGAAPDAVARRRLERRRVA